MPLANVPKHLYDTLEGSARMLQSRELGKALASVGPLIADAQTLLRRLDKEAGPLLTSLKGTSDTARASLVDITRRLDRVAADLQADASRLMTSLTATSDTARGTVKDVGDDLQKTLAQLTPQIAALAVKLQEVSDTLRGTLETTHTTLREKASSTGFTRRSSASSPPTNSVSCPSRAPSRPPSSGASSRRAPRASSLAPTSRTTSGALVV